MLEMGKLRLELIKRLGRRLRPHTAFLSSGIHRSSEIAFFRAWIYGAPDIRPEKSPCDQPKL